MRLDEAMRALREESANAEAPARVEADLLAAFRAQKKRRSPMPWVLAIAAALVVTGFVSVLLRKPAPPERWGDPVVARRPESQVTPKVQTAPVETKRVPVAVRKPRRPALAKQAPMEAWSDFVPVPYAPPMNVNDGAQLVRVRLPKNTLQSFGVSMPADRVYERFNAEVMVGQDGVVRAIRFAK